MTERDDIALLREFAATESEAAFAALVERHVNLVYSTALRCVGNAHAAQEITQAVFIILAKKARDLSAKIILSGWLYQTTRLTAANFLRGEIRRQQREQEAYMQSTLNEPDADVWPQIAPLLDDALAKLGAQDRNAIVLRFFENKNFREVGSALGASEDAAKMRVNRALEKLRKIFTKRGVTLSAAIIAGAVSANSVQAAPAGLAATISATAVKGSAIAASTLTLIKGTLKIMAWTKMKTTMITSAVIVLATVSTLTVTSHLRHVPPHQTGRLKLPTGNVRPMIAYSYSRFGIVLASDGSLWSWGEERNGWPVLGLENTNLHGTISLRRIGNGTDWANVSVGDSQSFAVKSDGSLWAWGENLYYQLGDGTKKTRPTPVPSIQGNDWKQVASGSMSSFALKTDGTLWAWGNNWAGQLGIGSTKASTNAVQVGTSTNWTQIWAGGIQTVGLQSDGSLWFWGSRSGSANDQNTILVPTRVSPDTNWTDVCFGYFTIFAIKSDGTLWCWGKTANFYTLAKDAGLNATPTQVGTESDWQSCRSTPGGFYHVLMKKDGSLWALDASDHRQVKPDTKYQPVTLRKIDLHKEIADFASGGDDIGVVLTRDGEVWTWGRVIGELSPKDYWGPKGKRAFPNSRVIIRPWQLANIDSAE